MVSVLASNAVDGGVWIKPIGICCFSFSAKHAALRSKSKGWLALNQNNVSEWSNIFTPQTVVSVHELALKHVTQLSVLVYAKRTSSSSKCNLISP